MATARHGPGDRDSAVRRRGPRRLTAWDPVSKQPIYKVASVHVTEVAAGDGAPSPRADGLFHGTRSGGRGLLRDLQDLYLMAAECDIAWTLIGQAARGLRDTHLLNVVTTRESETAMQLKWTT